MSRRLCLILLLAAVALPALALAQDFPPLLGTADHYAAPFPEGERLSYEIYWKPLFLLPALKAGEVRLEIGLAKNSGPEVWRIRAWADSDGALTRIAGIEVRNYFESDIDRWSFRSYRNLQKTREGKRQRDLELHFDYDHNRTLVRETDPSATPERIIRNQVKNGIPAPAVDILSAFYVTRLRRFSPGDRFLLHLNDRGEFQPVRVVALRQENVKIPLGSFPSILLTTEGGLFRDGGDFRLWISQDELRIPLRFEADVKFGKVYGNLVRLETPRLQRGLIRLH